jgi:Ca2+-binding EF-hand superfamily protein
LGKFLELFRQIDTDADGIVSEEEFCQLFIKMNIGGNMQSFVELLDPSNSNKITISSIIQLFTTHKLETEENVM